MIDLEEALAPLVERAPDPPALEAVARRGRRHRRRRAVALVSALVLVAVVAGGAIAAMADRDEPRVTTPPGEVDRLRVTLLDGSQLDIRGPASLGLTELPVSFNAELDYTDNAPPGYNPSHSFSVGRAAFSAATRTGVVLERHRTADGHELVVYETFIGTEAVVRYGEWYLIVHWSDDPAHWATFANALHASPNAEGFLVVEPPFGWRLGPTDGPDARLGDYAFFGPAHSRCLGTFLSSDELCNADGVLARALDPSLADYLDDIDVDYTPPPAR